MLCKLTIHLPHRLHQHQSTLEYQWTLHRPQQYQWTLHHLQQYHSITPSNINGHSITPSDINGHSITPSDINGHSITLSNINGHCIIPSNINGPPGTSMDTSSLQWTLHQSLDTPSSLPGTSMDTPSPKTMIIIIPSSERKYICMPSQLC